MATPPFPILDLSVESLPRRPPIMSTTDWAHEMYKNNRQPQTREEIKEMARQMDQLGLKGAYNRKNVYPGSPFIPSEFPQANEVRRRAKAGSEKVLADWQILRKIVKRHAEVLEKRWAKKTRKKQKELLLEAWPNMSASHRPDFEAYMKENTGRRLGGLSAYQEAFLWPYINQDDLSTKSLVIFMLSRARSPPSAFARADIDATRLGNVGHFIPEPAHLDHHTLFMDGDTCQAYGRLVSWDEDRGAADLMFEQRQFTPGEGLRVFDLQAKIYPFLIKCCELILHDFSSTGSLLDDRFPALAETLTKNDSSSSTETLPSLASISAEAPYRLPANWNLNRLRAIFAARLSAAGDHLWALREDPGYFAETVMDWSEHRNDRLLDTRGQPHPTGPHTTDFWTRVIRNVIGNAYSTFETWSLLHRHANKVQQLQDKYNNEIRYEKQLPDEYLVEILKLRQLLTISYETPLHFLQNIQSSPPLRHWFTREPQDPNTINMHIRPINEKDPHFHRPWGLLLILWQKEQRELFGFSNVIDAFEKIMQDPAEKKNLSPYIANLFSDLAILAIALREIETYQPWAATFDMEAEKRENSKKLLDLFKEATWQVEYMEHMDEVLLGITPLAMPGDRKFYYPVEKKRTKENTEKMIEAEKNLDHFWLRFDANWRRLAGKSINACMGDHTPRQRENGQRIERTAPWVEPVKEPKPNVETPKEPRPWNDSDEKDSSATKSKQKRKTKGAAQNSDVSNKSFVPEKPVKKVQTDKQPTFKVDKATLKVFNTLFFRPGISSLPGEIPWVEFLRAMTITGFGAQKLYGSIWQFTPTNLDVERSIQFHEPHPLAKIRFPVARRIGRRLTRAYGWHSGMFELKE